MTYLSEVEAVYGPSPNLYSILSVPSDSSTTEIREAYFCLQYDMKRQLSSESAKALNKADRAEIEAKMVAITATFRILTDPNKRANYDAVLEDKKSRGDFGEKASSNYKSVIPITTRVGSRVFGRKESKVKPSSSQGRTSPQAVSVTSFRKKNMEQQDESYDTIFDGKNDRFVTYSEEEASEAVQAVRDDSPQKKNQWSSQLQKMSSPTGVEDFGNSLPKTGKSKSKSRISIEKSSQYSFDEDTTEVQDDDTRTYDDDTHTYDDDTNYDDVTEYDDTTVGDTVGDTTVGESTYASYDDETYASEGAKRHSPGHKKGNRPEPILKQSSKNSGKDDRRVTIHSHRGRKSRGDDNDFADTMCPFPSITDIKEEVKGTYKDASQAFHQVFNAFVIAPDDIDRMSDKIRDAKAELAENRQA